MTGEPQIPHQILSSSDLHTWNLWQTLRDFDGEQTIIDPEALSAQRKFYRARRLD